MAWNKVPVEKCQLSLGTVLRCGQSFRWKQTRQDVWSLAFKRRVFFVKHEDDYLYYRAEGPQSSASDSLDIIHDYFNLDIDLKLLMAEWASQDGNFVKSARSVQGVRILRQDPWECLCSFICSTNNNIKRISQMVEDLCRHYGEYLGTFDGHEYYDFPGPQQLCGSEAKLRSLGFGYRAKYIQKTAEMVHSHPDKLGYLLSLREKPYREAHGALLQFAGVGPKVADCVCLMSLDKHSVVPVDTHVWQIAQRDYQFARNFKTLNKVAYQQVGEYFQNLWGTHAGWAHSVLFTANLKDLNSGLNPEVAAGIKEQVTEGQDEIQEDNKVRAEKVPVKRTVKKGTKRALEDTELPEPTKVQVVA